MIVAWVLALVLLLPVIITVGSSTSLNEGTATGSMLESVQASNLISAQFANTVANSTLLVVVKGSNVSSVATQNFVGALTRQINLDPGIKGLSRTTDVYAPLYSSLEEVNRATYSAETGANGTAALLLGVPALYLRAWNQTYSSTHSVTAADGAAFTFASNTLSSANSTAFNDYEKGVLSLFNSTWVSSWSDAKLANLTFLQRGSLAAEESGMKYAAFTPAKSFDSALLKSISLAEYMTDNSTEKASRTIAFAEGYVSNSTGLSQELVSSAYGLGRTYDNSSLYALTADVIWKPGAYGVGCALSSLISSLVSPRHDLTLVTVSLNESSSATVHARRSAVSTGFARSDAGSGVQSALVTGGDAISYDFGQSAQSDLSLILPITIMLLIVATGLFFRSVLTPLVTLGTIGVALGISQVFIVLVATLVAKVDFTVPTILLTILIGVGTDYSVFILARYREERVKGSSVQDAVEFALERFLESNLNPAPSAAVTECVAEYVWFHALR